jgi:hypothetical protein
MNREKIPYLWVWGDIKQEASPTAPHSSVRHTMAPRETTPLVKQSAADEENFAKLKAYQP